MKKTIIFCLTILWLLPSFSQNEDIKAIKQKVEEINETSAYKQITLENLAFLDSAFVQQRGEGYGKLTGYFKKDSIELIEEHIGIRKLKDSATAEYYFQKGQLIFVMEREERAEQTIKSPQGTIDSMEPASKYEGRYYFKEGKLIHKTQQGESMLLPNENYFDSQSKEGQLLYSANKYVELLSRGKKK